MQYSYTTISAKYKKEASSIKITVTIAAHYGLNPKRVSQSEFLLLFHFASATHAEELSLAHPILEHLHTEKLYEFGVNTQCFSNKH